MDRHLDELRASRRLPGVDAIRLPGEERRRRRIDRSENGIKLPPALIRQLEELATKLKIKPLAAAG
jgi:LDH2 family malate/lactate/ureidoglycolate dehydrogenase